MRREIILLVVGLAAVAALPMQESVASTLQDDLYKILLSANLEDNDLFMDDSDTLPASPIKTGEEAPHEEVVQEQSQQQPEPQDPPQEQTEPQDPPQEQTEPQDPPKEEQQTQPQSPPQEQQQAESQDPPQEHQQAEPQSPPQEQTQAEPLSPPQEQQQAEPLSPPQEQTQPQPQSPQQEQTQSQPQDDETEPAQESSLPHDTEDELPIDETMLNGMEVRPKPQLILVDPHESSVGPGDLEGDEAAYYDPEMEGLPIEPDGDYVVLHVKEETPSQDMEGTFKYEPLPDEAPYDKEEGPLSFNPEELPSDFQADSVPFESGPQMQPFLAQILAHMEPLAHDSELPLDHEEPLSSDPHTESDYEQMPLESNEGPDDEYAYEFPEEDYEPNPEEGMPLDPESAPAQVSYYSDHADVPVDLLSWLVPDFFDGEPTDYDESLDDSSYYDQGPGMEDRRTSKPEALFEPRMSDAAQWEKPSSTEINGATDFSDGSLLGSERDVVVIETEPLSATDSSERENTDDVSLADFFIPTYGDPSYINDPQQYSNATPEDEDEDYASADEETFPVDDGLVQVNPYLITDLDELEQEQPDTMFFGEALSENNPSEDGRYIAPWTTGSDRIDSREPEEDEGVTIFETEPIRTPDVETDMSYPSLLEILEKDTAVDRPAQPWSIRKSLMIDFAPEANTMVDNSVPMERDYLSENPNDNAVEIIMINDPREIFDDSPATPQREPTPITWYQEDHYQQPYSAPYKRLDQSIPKVHYSVIDEVPRRRFPGFFERMNDQPFSFPMPKRSRETDFTEDPFSFMNEIHDEERFPQFLGSTRTSNQHKFRDLDSPFSARNYPRMSTTPRLSFQDLLQGLNPSYYNMHVGDVPKPSPSLYYPQSYNPFLRNNGLPKQYSHSPLPVPYSSPFNPFQDNDYLAEENYYPNRLERLSSSNLNNMPSGIFREDTMPEMYSPGPERYYEDYTTELPFMSSYSYNSPHSLFPIYERPQYEGYDPSFNRPRYPQDSYYRTGPYYPMPLYSRYAPDYYRM